MKNYKIISMPGDGIGPEVVRQGIKVIDAISKKFGYHFEIKEELIGGCSIDQYGIPLTNKVIELCQNADAVLVGAVGGPRWDSLSRELRPEAGLLQLRLALNLYANLRHGRIYNALKNISPLKEKYTNNNVDIMIVRELTGGIYFGERGTYQEDMNEVAYDIEKYSSFEIERIGKVAFYIARRRGKNVVSIDKANILESSRLWRKIIENVANDFQDIEVKHMYADNAAMQLIKVPGDFDVLVTSNLFGDILSDELSIIIGSIGMLPSASLGDGKLGLYEPIHGSAPYLTGKNSVNPIATILSISMMMRYSLGLDDAALEIDNAITRVLDNGFRTKDIFSGINEVLLGTEEMGNLISEQIIV